MAFVTIKDKDNATLGHLQTDAQERLGVHNLLHVRDQKAAGVDGGDFTAGAYRTRDLNTVVVNNIAGASLDSNQVTLPAGTYLIEGRAPALGCSNHQARLQAISPSAATVAEGSPSNSPTTNGSVVFSFILCTVTFAAQTVLEVQHKCYATRTAVGFGAGYDIGQALNIFSDLKIWKVA